MSYTALSAEEFDQDARRAKEAAKAGPVFIMDQGRPAHVLLSIDAYRKLSGTELTLGEALEQPNAPDFDFTPPRAGALYRAPDLS